VFNNEHGTSSVIKGTYKCSGNIANPGNITTAGSGSGAKKGGAIGISTPSNVILLAIAGALAGIMSML
jgi:hypothetical protein